MAVITMRRRIVALVLMLALNTHKSDWYLRTH
jgi:hypothetical protein